MNGNLDPAWIAIAVIVLLAVALVAWWMGRRVKSRTLRKEFGPEYEHEVTRVGSRSRAESELEERRRRVMRYDLREIDPASKADLGRRWHALQREFVDHPSRAVQEAALLVDEAMELRGYPLGEIRQQQADLSVHYPEEVQDYRAAYGIAERNRRGETTTEELREATVRYRNLFARLVGLDEPTKIRRHA